jgi:hypothetical protein
MAKVCSVCKTARAPEPTDTAMTCPLDGAVSTVSRCGVCSTAPRSNGIVASAEDVAANTAGAHDAVTNSHAFA